MLKFEKRVRLGQPWTRDEDEKLRALAQQHAAITIAKLLDRSVGSVHGRAAVLNVKISHRMPKIPG
jgi:hypothetical protein